MAVKGKQSIGQIGITLIVQDVAAAADFYRDVIGAEESGAVSRTTRVIRRVRSCLVPSSGSPAPG